MYGLLQDHINRGSVALQSAIYNKQTYKANQFDKSMEKMFTEQILGMAQGSELRAQGAELRAQSTGLRAQSTGLRAQGSVLRAQGSGEEGSKLGLLA